MRVSRAVWISYADSSEVRLHSFLVQAFCTKRRTKAIALTSLLSLDVRSIRSSIVFRVGWIVPTQGVFRISGSGSFVGDPGSNLCRKLWHCGMVICSRSRVPTTHHPKGVNMPRGERSRCLSSFFRRYRQLRGCPFRSGPLLDLHRCSVS